MECPVDEHAAGVRVFWSSHTYKGWGKGLQQRATDQVERAASTGDVCGQEWPTGGPAAVLKSHRVCTNSSLPRLACGRHAPHVRSLRRPAPFTCGSLEP